MAQDFVIPIPFIRRRVNYAAVRRAYLEGYPPLLRRTTEVVGVVALIVGIVAEGPWRIGGLVVAAYAAHRIDKLNAHLDGHLLGYVDGRDAGGQEALELTDAKALECRRAATGAELSPVVVGVGACRLECIWTG